MCKTLMTGAILGYPAPTLIAWGQTFEQGMLVYRLGSESSLTCCLDNTLGGGSHIAKINGVLEYLDAMDPSTDNDLIFMLDAYGRSIIGHQSIANTNH